MPQSRSTKRVSATRIVLDSFLTGRLTSDNSVIAAEVKAARFHRPHDRKGVQIVSGIGFIGAGAILHDRTAVHGLTTAASLWVTAAMGMAVGAGMLVMSLLTAVLVFVILRFGPRPGVKTTEGAKQR